MKLIFKLAFYVKRNHTYHIRVDIVVKLRDCQVDSTGDGVNLELRHCITLSVNVVNQLRLGNKQNIYNTNSFVLFKSLSYELGTITGLLF